MYTCQLGFASDAHACAKRNRQEGLKYCTWYSCSSDVTSTHYNVQFSRPYGGHGHKVDTA